MDFTPFLAEIWTLYGLGSLMVFARVYVRTSLVGVRGYRPDDYLVWFACRVSPVSQEARKEILTPETR